jgi:hypothetical protein
VTARFLPPSEPPDPIVAATLDELRRARAEHREASRIIALLLMGPQTGDAPLFVVRRRIELEVAQRRQELWSDEVRRLEVAARALGLNVS